MGRKSNTKKKIRKLAKEGKIDPKDLKELKKKLKTKEKPPEKTGATGRTKKFLLEKKEFLKQKLDRRTIFGGTFALIMLALLITVGYLIFNRAFRPAPIAQYLPVDDTIALLEININPEHNQYLKTFELLKNYPQYSEHSLTTLLDQKFKIDFKKDIQPWIGRQSGLAYLHSRQEAGRTDLLYFVEIFSDAGAQNFLRDKFLADYSGKKVYKTELPIYLIIHGNYMIFSLSEKAIYEFIDNADEGFDTLYDSSKYRKIEDNLPLSKVAFLYFDFDEMTDGFFKELPFFSEKGVSVEAMRPFLKLFEAEGIALIATDINFALESFLTLDARELSGGKYITFREKYGAQLADYILADTLAFWGGQNLEYQLGRMIEVLSGGEEGAELVFQNLLQNYAQKYFGNDVSFQDDILALFKNEFAVAIENSDNKHIYKIVLELDDPKNDALKIHQIADNFARIGGIFEPKVVEHKLEDGTVAREIVAIPEKITKNESKHRDTTIYELKMGQQDWGLYFAFINDLAIIANNIDGVKSTVDIIAGDRESLRESEFFHYNIAPVLRSSDEISYFNFQDLLPVLFGNRVIPSLLQPIASLSSGKNYFNDGIKSINYLHIR